MKEALALVKQKHFTAYAGVKAIHELNGHELCKWIKDDIFTVVTQRARECTGHTTRQSQQLEERTNFNAQLQSWMEALMNNLLHAEVWTDEQINAFESVVQEIQSVWQAAVHKNEIPKLHMLTHCVEFARLHRALGLFSEASIEAYHAQFKRRLTRQHFNLGRNVAEKQRRTLADLSLVAAQAHIDAASNTTQQDDDVVMTPTDAP